MALTCLVLGFNLSDQARKILLNSILKDIKFSLGGFLLFHITVIDSSSIMSHLYPLYVSLSSRVNFSLIYGVF